MSLARSAPDDDGAVQIEFMTKIINMKNVYLESPELKVSLFDRTGAEIENNSDSSDLTPYSAAILRPSCWGLKPKKLKGGSVEFSITKSANELLALPSSPALIGGFLVDG